MSTCSFGMWYFGFAMRNNTHALLLRVHIRPESGHHLKFIDYRYTGTAKIIHIGQFFRRFIQTDGFSD
jgi:hypothetical protein